MALDIWGRGDVGNILDSVESMGGDVRTLNAVRRAFDLTVHPEPALDGTWRMVEMGNVASGLPGSQGEDPLQEFDKGRFDWWREQIAEMRRRG